MNVVLVGFMGTGKTSIGMELSRLTGMPFVDTDEIISRAEQRSVPAIFREHGEAYFRGMEREVVAAVALRSGVIVATGGGVMQDAANVKALRASGTIIWLKTEPEVIMRRTMSENGSRPLLNVDDPLKEIKRLLALRKANYAQADITMDTSYASVGETASDICARLALARPTVRVELGDRSYDILIGHGVLDGLAARLKGLRPTGVAVISNPTVFSLYGEKVERGISEYGIRPVRVIIPDGESYKDLMWYQKIMGDLLAARFDRRAVIVALGGGVIGDMAGFAASTYMRGIRCVQVPTTLLSQVDSSVGGKTGVNHPLGKNMIGAFFQPSLVVMDQDVLATLPEREMRAGMAEIIKYGVIRDAGLFDMLGGSRDEIMSRGPALERIIARSCAIKADVVASDERESGVRAILNYGHTVGHAIETLTGYTRYLHGEAIAIGMRVAADLAVRMKLTGKDKAAAIRKLITSYGLPTSIPGELRAEALIDAMLLDKKAVGKRLKFILPTDIGAVKIVDDVEDATLWKALAAATKGEEA
jgi:3-dehydroquinate synthase